MSTIPKKIIMTGLQPTGVPHIGNYFGAIRQILNIQSANNDVTKPKMYDEFFVGIVDLHALTAQPASTLLRKNTFMMAASLLGCGLDPTRITLYQQSKLCGLGDLAWILSTICPMTDLEKIPTWREKLAQQSQSQSEGAASMGLFSYALLQAADIISLRASRVPVGSDQAFNFELCRKLVERLNHRLRTKHASKLRIPLPEMLTSGVQAHTADTKNHNDDASCFQKIQSLTIPTSKMSKSDQKAHSRIELLDTPEQISSKIRSAMTDSIRQPEIEFEPESRPGISNLIRIGAAIHDTHPRVFSEAVTRRNLTKTELKSQLSEEINEFLRPIRVATLELVERRPEYVQQVLEEGSARAQSTITRNIEQFYAAIGCR